MPKPKKTESTAPMAVSSASRVRWMIHSTSQRPRSALAAEPTSSPASERPSPPIATIAMKASPMPGRVACATASETSARRARTRKVPAAPAAIPSRPAPIATSAAL